MTSVVTGYGSSGVRVKHLPSFLNKPTAAAVNTVPFSTPEKNVVNPKLHQAFKAYHQLHFSGWDATSLIESITQALTQTHEKIPERMTFNDYLEKVIENPNFYLKTANEYTLNALEHFGTEHQTILGQTLPVQKFQYAPWIETINTDTTDNSSPVNYEGVYGQELVVNQLIKKLRDSQGHPSSDKIMVFFGPHGSGKSHLMSTMFKTLEQFSNTDEGVKYTFSWVFPKSFDRNKGGPVGFLSQEAPPRNALLNIEDIAYEIPSYMNVNPIFLLPQKERMQLINQLVKDGKLARSKNLDYFRFAHADNKSEQIFEALLRHYRGDIRKVLDCIEVRRWRMASQDGRGLAEVNAGQAYDAQVTKVSHDDSTHELPYFLRIPGLKDISGPLVDANGGLLYYDDFGRDPSAPMGRYTALLQADAKGGFSLGQGANTVKENLDMVILASANPQMKQSIKDLGALSKRMIFIPVPYVRLYREEAKVYQSLVTNLKNKGGQISPECLNAFSLWITMSRLKPIHTSSLVYNNSTSQERTVLNLIKEPLQKALYYQGESPLAYWDTGTADGEVPDDIQKMAKSENMATLKKLMPRVAEEHNYLAGEVKMDGYEGSFGIDPRKAKEIFKSFLGETSVHNHLTLLDLFSTMGKECSKPDIIQQLYNGDSATEQQEAFLPAARSTATGNRNRLNQPVFDETATTMDERTRRRYRDAHLADTEKWLADALSLNKPLSTTQKTEKRNIGFSSDPMFLLKLVEDYEKRKLITELKISLGMFRPESFYVKQFEKYMEHLKARLTKNFVPEPFREGEREEADINYMLRQEKLFAPQTAIDNIASYRQDLLIRLNHWDNTKSNTENLQRIFADEIHQMQVRDIQNQHKEKFDDFKRRFDTEQLKWYTPPEQRNSHQYNLLFRDSAEKVQLYTEALDKLVENPDYPRKQLSELLAWAFSENYISDGSFQRQTK